MRIDRSTALAEVMRLRYLEFFPASDEAFVKDLVEVLAESRTPAIASAVVSAWLKEHRERPTPADLYEEVRRRNWEQVAQERLSLPECPDCGGVGQRIRTRMHKGEEITVASLCVRCGGSGRWERSNKLSDKYDTIRCIGEIPRTEVYRNEAE